jgi:thiol-disulfide isomerase/thioredoxin/uncharacterized membrane protein HdeD (DUF308 family)
MKPNKTISLVLLVITLVLFFLWLPSTQAQAQTPSPVIVYMFWGDGCPHCAEAEPFLEGLAQKYPGVELRFYEVWNNADNLQLLKDMAAKAGFEPTAVPTIFIGDRYWTGYSEALGQQIEDVVQGYLVTGIGDPGEGLDFSKAVRTDLTESTSNSSAATPQPTEETNPIEGNIIQVPLIGAVNLETKSLFVSTLLISFVDGVNPCSIWVLTMLLALVVHTGSRRKVVLIGLVFLSVTALVYALFIAGLFSVLSFASYLIWVRSVVALVSLVFALINIKDYFWYKKGVSLTIADDQKPGIFQKMRKVMDASNSFWGLVGATVVLSAGVSLVEFSCTAGFPVLWTNLLTSQNVSILTFVLLLLVYMLIYQLDELVIFFSAVYTLKATRLEEKQGRILKLFGGTLMLALGLVMLINPALMSDLTSSLIIFGLAFAVTGLVLFVHRWLLPRLGVIEAEEKPRGHGHRSGKGSATRPNPPSSRKRH